MTYLDELRDEKQRIEFVNNVLRATAADWSMIVSLSDDDVRLAADYINDMINDTVGTRLRNITAEIAELETEDGQNPAKLTKGELL